MIQHAGRWLLLTVTYVVLFLLGSATFVPAGLPTLSEQEQATATIGVLGMAAIDAALILVFVRRSSLHGWRLMALLAGVFYFVKTLTSQIEAVFFMPNVTAKLLPSLLLMTVPLTLAIAPFAVWLGGRARASSRDREPGFEALGFSRRALTVRVALLSAVGYPALFFLAGWFIAFRSPELRAFYGASVGPSFFAHVASLDLSVYALEVLRGALWVACALLMLCSMRGSWWISTLLVAAWFALLQNDVHFIPNPLMSPTVRLFHFVETASSNAVWALLIGWVLHPAPRRHTQ